MAFHNIATCCIPNIFVLRKKKSVCISVFLIYAYSYYILYGKMELILLQEIFQRCIKESTVILVRLHEIRSSDDYGNLSTDRSGKALFVFSTFSSCF